MAQGVDHGGKSRYAVVCLKEDMEKAHETRIGQVARANI